MPDSTRHDDSTLRVRPLRTTTSTALRQLVTAVIALAALAFAGAVALAWVPRWPCVLLQHFPVQLAAAGLVVTVLAAVAGVRGAFDLAAIATLVCAVQIAPDFTSSARPLPAGGAP